MLKESPVVTVYAMLMSKLCHRCVTHSDRRTLRSDDAYTDEYAFAVQRNASTFPVEINGLPVGVIIDSGASLNIVNSAVADQLRDIGSGFQKCQRFIRPYRSPPIECKEYLPLKISVSGVQPVLANFLVVPGCAPSLLSRTTAEKLGIL